VEEPDISLKRFVVPRVAPMLDCEVVAAPGVDWVDELLESLVDPEELLVDDELEEVVELVVELEVELELVVVDPLEPPDPPENVLYRSLRLPRIWGAMMVANRSAWIVPATRIPRWTSPTVTLAVRMTNVVSFAGVEAWGRVLR
jgi:hypothetical protein